MTGTLPGVPAKRIVLTGFMGAGKTTVGQLLATRLGWRFLDVDLQIESETGVNIAELFAQHGEPWFRQREHETIHNLLTNEALVLALGGGAIEDPRTRALLLTQPGTRLIHLEATIETVLLRCAGTESIRPILRDHANLETRYQRRLPLYRESHHSIPVDSLAPAEVAESILTILNHWMASPGEINDLPHSMESMK